MKNDLDILKDLSLAEQLARVSRLWRSVADKELHPLGLTHPRWTALWKLQRLGDNISQKHLADALEIELSSLMRTLSQLEEQGLVTRVSCSTDKRVRIVRLTPAGSEFLKQLETRIVQVRRQLLEGLDSNQINQLSLMLEQIAHNALDSLNE